MMMVSAVVVTPRQKYSTAQHYTATAIFLTYLLLFVRHVSSFNLHRQTMNTNCLSSPSTLLSASKINGCYNENDLIHQTTSNSQPDSITWGYGWAIQLIVHAMIMMVTVFGVGGKFCGDSLQSLPTAWAATSTQPSTMYPTSSIPTTSIQPYSFQSSPRLMPQLGITSISMSKSVDPAATAPSSELKNAKGRTLQDVATQLTVDLTMGSHGEGGYFLTGDLTRELFKDDCVFEDPTTSVNNLDKYQNVLKKFLFEPPPKSSVELLGPLQIDETSRTISGRLRSRGYLKLPWKPYIKAYETTITYTVNDDGLISKQSQYWSKPASTALLETFTPSWTDPPPKSSLGSSSNSKLFLENEPAPVKKLFEYVNGRRPNEYSDEERSEIDDLITQIVSLPPKDIIQSSKSLSGKWILSYLQPGRDGAGIDRRIPFPEFDFNDNYQVFSFPEQVSREEESSSLSSSSSSSSSGRITNVGQLLGPLITVEVSGDVQELKMINDVDGEMTSRSPSDTTKRYIANINGGKLCLSPSPPPPPPPSSSQPSNSNVACAKLPIQGEGIFDSIYVGPRLRIGQNINGGGARVVQIRL